MFYAVFCTTDTNSCVVITAASTEEEAAAKALGSLAEIDMEATVSKTERIHLENGPCIFWDNEIEG